MVLREAGTLPPVSASSNGTTVESPTDRIGLITLATKPAGKPIAGNRHDGFDEAGAGNEPTRSLGASRQPSTLPEEEEASRERSSKPLGLESYAATARDSGGILAESFEIGTFGEGEVELAIRCCNRK